MRKEIALDANGSFSISECQQLEENPSSTQFTYIEQLMKTGISNYSHLSANKYTNWMADEDCQEQNQLSELKSHYKTINIKLVKTGGLTPALQLIKEARANDFKNHDRLHDRIYRRNFSRSGFGSVSGLCRFRWREFNCQRHRFWKHHRKGKVLLSEKVG